MNRYVKKPFRGTGLIEAIVSIAVMLLVFGGFFSVFQISIELMASSKVQAGAVALATEQMEFTRSLAYDDVGTLGGLVPGGIPQNENIVLNGITYNRRTFIKYMDDPADGFGVADGNGITADYKQVKVELSWTYRGVPKSISQVTNIVPRGIETLAGGGTLNVNVIDALALPVEDASIRIVNNTSTPTIDTTVFTNAAGMVSFPGATSSSEYEITVTKAGYSTAQTYTASVANPNPNPAHLTVTAGNTTESTFAIDQLSIKTVRTYEAIRPGEWVDPFDDTSKIASSTYITVAGGEARLELNGPDYRPWGALHALSAGPTYVDSWDEIVIDYTEPANTSIIFQVLDQNLDLIPDVDLPFNSVGTTTSSIDVSGLDPATYTSLRLTTVLTSSDVTQTPVLRDWRVKYNEGPIPLPNIPFAMRGDKTIGTDADLEPIYKYQADHTTDIVNGSFTVNNIEWDNYTIVIDDAETGYDISEMCGPQPFALQPNTNVTRSIHLVADTPHSLLAIVFDDNGIVLPDAAVRVHRAVPAFDQTATTSSCGQVFFGGVAQGTVAGGNAYSIQIDAPGFSQFTSTDDIEINGSSTQQFNLIP